MSAITVYNLHHQPSEEEPIWPMHRPYPLGNPYRPGIDEEPIQKFKSWLWQGIKARDGRWHELIRLARIYKQKGTLNLGCFCKPKPCHTDVIKDAVLYVIKEGLPENPPAIALIGPRKITLEHSEYLTRLGSQLQEKYPEYVFRSGGAPGADQAWMRAIENGEIFLPWPRFEWGKHPSSAQLNTQPLRRAMAWANLTHQHAPESVRKLMSRNWNILLGEHLSQPVQAVLYANDGSKVSGGTANTVKVADWHGIPAYPINIGSPLPDLSQLPSLSA